MRAGLAMFFQTLDDPWLMEIAAKIVAELELDHFFNIQLVGDKRDRDQPADLDDRLPGGPEPAVPRREARARRDLRRGGSARSRRGSGRRGSALRYFDQVEWDVTESRFHLTRAHGTHTSRYGSRRDGTARSGRRRSASPLPGQHRRDPVGELSRCAARRRRAARRLQPRQAPPRRRRRPRPPGRVPARPADPVARARRLLPRTDVFHFYFGLTLVPKSVQFPLLRAFRKKSRLPLPRLRHPRQDARAARLRQARRRGDRRLVRRDPLGARGGGRPARDRPREVRAGAALDRARPIVLHAPSSRGRKGTEHVVAACAELDVDLASSRGSPTRRRGCSTRRPTSSSTS